MIRFVHRCLLLSVAALAACHSASDADALTPSPKVQGDVVAFADGTAPVGIQVATATGPGALQVQLPGRLGWDEDRTTRVYAPYAGRVERLLVAAGQHVKRGQPLAEVTSGDIGQAQADLHKAQADLGVARAAAQRARDLSEGGVIARKELEQAEADLVRAQAEASRATARLAQYGVTPDAVTQSMTLTAPLSGTVVERNLNPGQEVRTDVQGPALFTISDPSVLWATLDLDEAQLALVKPGQALHLRSAAWPGQLFAATVLSIGESVDAASRTVKVKAQVANADHRLKAEMFVTALVAAPQRQLLLPAEAVFQRKGRQCVFVQQKPGVFQRRAVSVHHAGATGWFVDDGLAPGDTVVVSGVLYLNQLLDADQ